jgi:riboflavin kinase, archaea type
MNDKFAIALKQIALLGGINDYIAISSRELGEKLNISQQSASKRILELLEEGLIQRDLGARKQRIKITKKGLDALRQEYSEYQKIFEMRDHLLIRGTVTTGMGEGQYYVNQPGYQDQFKEKLKFVPFEGTLNLRVQPSDLSKMDILRKSEGIIIHGFQMNGRTFGDVRCYPATIQNLDCAVILPSRSHYSDIMEVLCKYNLRRTLSLNDGDVVEIRVSMD